MAIKSFNKLFEPIIMVVERPPFLNLEKGDNYMVCEDSVVSNRITILII